MLSTVLCILLATAVGFLLFSPGGCVQPPTAQTESCGRPAITPSVLSDRRILGGEASVPGSWPWQVRIGEKVKGGISFFCGGTILNPLFIVTAGHCFPGSTLDARKYVIRVAEYNMSVAESVERDFGVLSIYKHPYYGSVGSPSNDVTLLRLSYPITFTNRISGICLPPVDSDPSPGRQCVVTGWGRFVDQYGNTSLSTPAPATSQTTHTTTQTSKNSRVSLYESTVAPVAESFSVKTPVLAEIVQSNMPPVLMTVDPIPPTTIPSTTDTSSSTTQTSTTSTTSTTTVMSTTHNSTKKPSVIITSERDGHIYKPMTSGQTNFRPVRRRRLRLVQQPSASSVTSHSEVLQQAVLPILDRKICSAYWKTLLRESMICTFPSHHDAEPCKGDSGGPLVCRNGEGSDAYWTLDGIISFGAGCGAKRPAVYTRVSSFLKWIEKTAKYPVPVPPPNTHSFLPFPMG